MSTDHRSSSPLLLLFPVLLLPLTMLACANKNGSDTGITATTDGGTTDTGATDGGTTDGGTPDGGTTDGGTTDGGTTDGGTTDGGTTDGGTSVTPDITVNIDLEDWATKADLDGLAVVLYQFDIFSGDLPSVPATGGTITGTTTQVPLDEPVIDDMQEIKGYPGSYFAFYMPTLVADTDGDLTHTKGEAIVALDEQYLAYFDGKLVPDLEGMGFVLGWNLFDFDTGLASAPVLDMTLNLADRGDTAVGGPVGLGFESTDRLALLSGISDLGDPPPMVDQLLTDPWSVDLSADPPASHQFSSADTFDAVIATEGVIAFADVDASGSASDGDVGLGTTCDGRDQVVLAWAQAPTAFPAAYYLHYIGLHAAWQAALVDGRSGSMTLIPSADLSSISITDTCISF